MKNESKSSGGIGCTGVLLIVFVTLKATGNIDWPWLWVLAPLWIPLGLVAALGLALGVVFLVGKALARASR